VCLGFCRLICVVAQAEVHGKRTHALTHTITHTRNPRTHANTRKTRTHTHTLTQPPLHTHTHTHALPVHTPTHAHLVPHGVPVPAGRAGVVVPPGLHRLLPEDEPAVGVALPREAPHRQVARPAQHHVQLPLQGVAMQSPFSHWSLIGKCCLMALRSTQSRAYLMALSRQGLPCPRKPHTQQVARPAQHPRHAPSQPTVMLVPTAILFELLLKPACCSAHRGLGAARLRHTPPHHNQLWQRP